MGIYNAFKNMNQIVKHIYHSTLLLPQDSDSLDHFFGMKDSTRCSLVSGTLNFASKTFTNGSIQYLPVVGYQENNPEDLNYNLISAFLGKITEKQIRHHSSLIFSSSKDKGKYNLLKLFCQK